MIRNLTFALVGILGVNSVAEAQVVINAPFVRLQVGPGGGYLKAPFVNLRFASGPRPILMAPTPGPAPFVPPAPTPEPILPAPRKVESETDVQKPSQALSLEAFAKSFEARKGNYEIVLLNPVTKQETPVRFSLPEGTPQQVQVTAEALEFRYGPRQFVRIRFDKDGAEVVSR